MKRRTAISHVKVVKERLLQCNGVIGTPASEFEFVRIKRAWVFGSTAKGNETPGDVDILVEILPAGRMLATNALARQCGRRGGARNHPARGAPKTYPACSFTNAYRFLSAGMKMVRFHDLAVDGQFGDIAATRILIYPRDDFLVGQNW